MSKSLAAEVASRGITVNCVAPGFIATAMTEALTDEQKARIAGQIPAGRMGTPEEIAAAAVFLASSEAGYVTGQTLARERRHGDDLRAGPQKCIGICQDTGLCYDARDVDPGSPRAPERRDGRAARRSSEDNSRGPEPEPEQSEEP